jgi:hypothetical protein
MQESEFNSEIARMASADFERARRKAFLNDVVALLGRRPNWLMAFEEIQRTLPIKAQSYKGMREVPVAAIVGSVDRYHDFDRAFLPIQTRTRPRWESVDRAALTDIILPPVQLYKVGEAYFVKDGNHRVSVAREKGADYIDAEVIELVTNVPVTPDTNPGELIRLGEYAYFLEKTNLDKLRPGVDVEFTSLGRYDVLLEHISAHRWYMGIEQNRPIEWQEAVLDWYDHIYMPVVKVIEEKSILSEFPGRTAGDLYLWIMDHRWYLHEETGHDIGPRTAAISYVEQYSAWTRRVLRYLRRVQSAAARPFVVSAQMLARAVKSIALRPQAGEGSLAPPEEGDQEPLAPSPSP